MNLEEKLRQTLHGNAAQRERTITLAKKIVFDGRRIDAERSESATGQTAQKLTEILRASKVLDPFTDELVEDVDTPSSVVNLDSVGAENQTLDAPAQPGPDPSESSSDPKPRRGRGRPKGSAVPKPRVPTRPPKNQNEHLYAVMNHPGLEAIEQHFGLVAHIKIGSDLRSKFGRPDAGSELTASELAREAKRGGSPGRAGGAMTKMVELGLFRRLDNGQGDSRRQGNPATYVPVVPDFGRSDHV